MTFEIQTLIRGCTARGRRFVWWHHTPIMVRVPVWWRWSCWLNVAIVASIVGSRVARDGMFRLHPARLEIA